MRIKHWTGLQWTGASIIISLPLMILALLSGLLPDGWWLVLVANAILAFFSLFFIAWPGPDGFRYDSEVNRDTE